jgi:hypothetical protein
MYAGDPQGYAAWIARLAQREGRDVGAYPAKPHAPYAWVPFDPTEDWDDTAS